MWETDEFDEDTAGTVFRDVLMLALIGFVTMVIMILPHVARETPVASEAPTPGNVVVEIHWPNRLTVDVDLWVQAPDDRPVGFVNQGSLIFNLLRDDLGAEGDATDQNYEVSYSRGIPAGEYAVNVHMYGPVPDGVTVPVRVIVSLRREGQGLAQILLTEVELVRLNQEETAFRFRLDESGDLVAGSVTTLKRHLVSIPWIYRTATGEEASWANAWGGGGRQPALPEAPGGAMRPPERAR